ncbi:hypothetical protein SASC598O11_003140 [Snodgrassella alvi SCGC AB-598-O11]|nr:hypothetical protein SASC598O11_003140 [Snodgrassella alvi SCGC AB-598-O11]
MILAAIQYRLEIFFKEVIIAFEFRNNVNGLTTK